MDLPPEATALSADPSGLAVSLVVALVGGIGLGTLTGLTPGLHVNAVALGLVGLADRFPSPLVAGVTVLAAGVVHSFLDVVPSLVLGVPDAAQAPAALPGHRLVLAGRGREALRLSAVGSAGATTLALPLAVPLSALAVTWYPTVRAALPVVLAAVAGALLLTERSLRAAAAGAACLAVSGALGVVSLPLAPRPVHAAVPGSVLAPLFAGLFGAPVLLAALDGEGVPVQSGTAPRLGRGALTRTTLAGTVAGALVGYLPGVSAGVAAALALPAVGGDGDDRDDAARRYVVATSGADTANALFALFALSALGTPRTGVTVALSEAAVPVELGVLVPAAVGAAAVGTALVVVAGDRYLRVVGRIDQRLLVAGVCALLVVSALLFAGPAGLVLLGAATVVGFLPPRLGCRRVHLMGVLVGPLVLHA
jgi:putative membrane protein